MDYNLISLWNQRIQSIHKICTFLDVNNLDNIRPLVFSKDKGVTLISSNQNKYIVKWNEEMEYDKYRFISSFCRWATENHSNIIPQYLFSETDLYYNGCFYFVYKYIDSVNSTDFIKMAEALATFHTLGKEFAHNEYYDNDVLNVLNWFTLLQNACEKALCLPNIYSNTEFNLKKYIPELEAFIDKNHCINSKPSVSICHGDMNLKNFLFGLDGTYTLVDMDTLSYNLPVKDLYGLLKSVGSFSWEAAVKCFTEYNKSRKLDINELDLLCLMCNPLLNLYLMTNITTENNFEYQYTLTYNQVRQIVVMIHLTDFLQKERKLI